MHASRYVCTAGLAVAVFTLSACGGGGGAGNAGGALAPLPSAQSATISLGSAGTAQSLPSVSGISSSIMLPANNAVSNATLTITLSTGAPANMTSIPAKAPQPFLYFTLQASSSATFNGLPKFTMTLPSAPQNQGAFYAWTYDTGTKAWTDFGPVNVSGDRVTFGGTSNQFTLSGGVQYVAVPFTAAPAASCPTPGPTPTPTPSPPPISGKYFVTTQDSNGNNGAFNTFDEQSGTQLATLNLAYPNGVYGDSIVLAQSGNLAYVAGYGPLVNGNPSTFPLPGLTIIDTASNSILHQTTIDGGIDAGALSPDGTRYYGAGEDVNGNEFFVFDASSGALLKTVALPEQLYQVVINPAGTTAYLPGANQIYTINLTTYALATLCSGGCNGRLAFDATGTKLFSVQDDSIVILNPTTGAQIGGVPVPNGVNRISPNGNASASFEAGNLQSFVVAEYNNDGSTAEGVVSTVSDSFVNTFKTANPYLDGQYAAVNRSGAYSLLIALGGGSAMPGGAVALPYGQQYFFQWMPTSNFYDAAAAQ